MYAAAGGASLASRRADKKKALQQKKNENQQKLLREKIAQAKASGSLDTPTKSKGFHQLPANYLRPPQGVGRKLSATYTGVQGSRFLLPINEGSFNDELRSPSGTNFLGISTSGLHRSQTATLPFMLQQQGDGAGSPPATPNICFPVERPPFTDFTYTNDPIDRPNLTLTIPGQEPITITPATPIPTPLHPNLLPTSSTAAYQLERKCSVHRRKLDPLEEQFYRTTNFQTAQELYNEEFRAYLAAHQSVFLPNGGQRQPWDEPWCLDPTHQQEGLCTCDHLECAQGRAAWLERGRKCSVQEETASTHNRYKPWIQRNRVQDVSLAGSSDDDDIISVIRGPSTFANAFLYIGFGTIALGLVIAFVGTGEKGFKTTELRLIGPIMIVVGFVFMVLRIFFCICPSSCIRRNNNDRKKRKKDKDKIDADHRTSLLRDKRVSIARTPMGPHSSQPKLSRSNTKSIVKTKTYEGVEALRQIATTSLFLQNETGTNLGDNSARDDSSTHRNKTSNNNNISKLASSLVVPTIKEPDKPEDGIVDVELKRISSIDVDTLNIIDNTATSPIDPHPFDPNDDYGNESYSDEDEEEEDDNDSKKLIESDNESSNKKVHASASASQSRTSSIKHSDSTHHRRSGSSKLSRQRLSINNQKVSPSTTTGALIPSPTPSQLSTDSGKVMETSLMILPAVVSTPPPVLMHQTSSTSSTTSVSSSPSTVISIPQLLHHAIKPATTSTATASTSKASSKFTFNLLSPPPNSSHFDFSNATLLQPLSTAGASSTSTTTTTSSRSNGTTATHTRQHQSSSSAAETSEIVLSPAKLGQQ